jgi:hypothetical protein
MQHQSGRCQGILKYSLTRSEGRGRPKRSDLMDDGPAIIVTPLHHRAPQTWPDGFARASAVGEA